MRVTSTEIVAVALFLMHGPSSKPLRAPAVEVAPLQAPPTTRPRELARLWRRATSRRLSKTSQ
jgi:hypothetical protein